jgi:NitT/TauT family transport system substrate-binding protein
MAADMRARSNLASALAACLLALAACGGSPAGQAASASAGGAAKAQLPTAPVINLKVGVQSLGADAPLFIAQDRGYFKDVGLNVEFVSTGSANEQIGPVSQGQLQVSRCSNSVGCYNAFQRGTDVRIVADMTSAGKTEKSKGSTGLVVRKDLWDSGAIRDGKDLIGRKVDVIAGPGSGQYAQAAHWLLNQGLDPLKLEWPAMNYPDMLAAMKNKGIELALQVEPLLSAGVKSDTHHILATQEEMEPDVEPLYLTYWTGIDKLGPMAGERFMVAYLRGARDSINAFEYGIDQDQIIGILTKNTVIKDANVYKTTKYSWIDPDGKTNPKSLQADEDLFEKLGVSKQHIDLSPAFDDKYRQFAVDYLGPYKPPR